MCVHELSVCDYCPETHPVAAPDFKGAAADLVAFGARAIALLDAQKPARIVPVPSTGDFTSYPPAFESATLTNPRQIPTNSNPRWAVTTEPQMAKYEHTAKHYERSIYGETAYVGLVERKS